MLSKRAIYGVFVYFFIIHICVVFGNIQFTKFIFHEEYTGLGCPEDSILFTDYENIQKCLLKCNRLPMCYGIFVGIVQGPCVGCAKQYLTMDFNTILNLAGSFYFRRRTFIKVNEKRSWDDSKKHCEDLGGYLADIKSQDEYFYILDHFHPDLMENIWIGATDLENEGIFMWRDGTKVTDFFHLWADNEPDIGVDDGDDHCVNLANRDMVVAWRDSYCGSKFASLCEFD